MEFRKKLSGFIIIIAVFASLVRLDAADLHVFLVGDLAADDLRSSVEVDLGNFQGFAENVSGNTGLELKIYCYLGGDEEPGSLLEDLQHLSVYPEDVIMFYYSGHGYRTLQKGDTPWPNLYFSGTKVGLELERVLQKLQEKQAHLTLVIADCCNNVLSEFSAPPLAKKMGHSVRSAFVPTMQNYRKLFLESTGTVVAASSKPGEVSFCMGKYGSLYTGAFLAAFDSSINRTSTEKISWTSIFNAATTQANVDTLQRGLQQEPIFSVEVD